MVLWDQNGWKVAFSGFVELDAIKDSTQSLNEIAGSSPVDKQNTFAGSNGRTLFSIRNTRLGFMFAPPPIGDWKTKGFFEYDLFGFDPTPNASSPTAWSESAFYTNPTLRLRHAYLSAEANGWQLLVGQTWTLFGFQPYYFLSALTVSPISGALFERTPQITMIKKIQISEQNSLQLGVSVVRPVQRDSQYPGLDGGLRMAFGARKSGITNGPAGDIKTQPMSIAISGSIRNFETPQGDNVISDRSNFLGTALATNFMLPILASSSEDGKSVGNTLTLQGEYSTGSGYADEFTGWSGGIGLTNTGNLPSNNNIPNLDGGQGGFSTPNTPSTFSLIQLQSFNMQLQYHLPSNLRTFVNLGYGQLWSPNVGLLTTNTNAYDRSETTFANIIHELTNQIRIGFEAGLQTTHFLDNNVGINRRFQLSFYYVF